MLEGVSDVTCSTTVTISPQTAVTPAVQKTSVLSGKVSDLSILEKEARFTVASFTVLIGLSAEC